MADPAGIAWQLSDLWYFGVPAIGAAVGVTEVISRYKDAPFLAAQTGPARAYVLVNALAALFAYVLIRNFDFKFGAQDQVILVQALVASLGSMAFFRSSLFSMKVGETDVSVGPAIFFQILLFATDRACDRERAKPRSADVIRIMQGVSFELARDSLPSFCFELMQNIPASEQQKFRLVIDALASSQRMPDSVKVLNLGLMLMNAVGQQVLEAAVAALGEKIQGPAKLELKVFIALQRADFDKAYPLLVDIAFIMSRYGSPAAQEAAKTAVLKEIEPLTRQPHLDNGAKMTQLGLSLQQRVGDAVLLAAIEQVADGIKGDSGREDQAQAEDAGSAHAQNGQQPQTLPPGGVVPNVTPIRPDVVAPVTDTDAATDHAAGDVPKAGGASE
ncbi:hypothetical protein [Bradyrhizobium sp. STM 3809]|uniref:hypothetical protein n=1 Tax=Bradyrhizobium sp. STM 3809 TaxID=551936 RepID=UPI0002408CE7|nr:hypothetical protein [Bradyrhizobium sp. STM 3809]CCE00080.1 conserved membrane hypothetical protein [Bradyrhizobium sp. STM 3809]